MIRNLPEPVTCKFLRIVRNDGLKINNIWYLSETMVHFPVCKKPTIIQSTVSFDIIPKLNRRGKNGSKILFDFKSIYCPLSLHLSLRFQKMFVHENISFEKTQKR